MIRIALVGVSGYGRCLLEAIRAVEAGGRCRLAAACIVNRSQEGALWHQLSSSGVACFEDTASLWRAMAGKIDLTILPTPPQTHRAYTLEALGTGSNVLCEKPTAVTLADAEEMASAATRAGRRLFIGFQDIYLEGTRRLKRDLLQGIHGRILSVSFLGLWSRRRSYYTRNSWAGRRSVDGVPVHDNPVSNAFAHFLNLGLFFCGGREEQSARPVAVEAELFRANAIETFDTAALRITTDRGVPFLFLCSHAVERDNIPTLRITTDRATLDWKYETGLSLKSEAGGEDRFLERLPTREEARIGMLENIVAALHGEEVPLCTPANALIPLGVSERLRSHAITPFPPEQLRVLDPDGDPLVIAEGLEGSLLRCLEKGVLPGELGAEGAGLFPHAV